MNLRGLESNVIKLNWLKMNKLKIIIKGINIFMIRSHRDLKLKLIFICSLEINLEKYMKMINNPLIIIKKIIIEYIKFSFQIDILIHLNKLNKIINIIIIIGWRILFIIIKIIINIKSHKMKKINLIILDINSKSSLLRILILEIKGVIKIIFLKL